MSRFLIAPIVILMLGIRMPMAADVQPDEGTIEGAKGLGIGALVGAIVGGPIGALVGAAGGAYFAESDAAKNTAIDDLEVKLDARDSELAELKSDFEQTQVAMSGNREILEPALERGPGAPLSLPVYFRTDSDEVDASLRPHLERLVAFLKSYPHLEVRLEGYSDRRGASDYNLTLSQRRIGAIRRILEDEGIESKRILAIAYGEARAKAPIGDGDAMVYDRAVVISIEDPDSTRA